MSRPRWYIHRNYKNHMVTIELVRLFNATSDTNQIPPDISKCIFIAIPKKAEQTGYDLHRETSQKHNQTKNILGLWRGRKRKKNIIILQTIIEGVLKVRREVNLFYSTLIIGCHK